MNDDRRTHLEPVDTWSSGRPEPLFPAPSRPPVTPMQPDAGLTHEDLVLLARLLGNHVTNPTTGADLLDPVGAKLVNYVVRTEGHGDVMALAESWMDPLPLKIAENEFYPGRVCFYCADPKR